MSSKNFAVEREHRGVPVGAALLSLGVVHVAIDFRASVILVTRPAVT